MFLMRRWVMLACCTALAACGGGNNDGMRPQSGPGTGTANPPARGTLIQSPPARTASLTPSTLLAAATSVPEAQRLLELLSPPKCGIDIHQLRYNTVDPAGAAITASGALMIPTGA